jgi:hypothetical protein
VNEVEKENAGFTQGLMNEVRQKTADLTNALELLTQAYNDTLEVLGSALGLKDAETEAHSQRVTGYTISIARNVPVGLQYLEYSPSFLNNRLPGVSCFEPLYFGVCEGGFSLVGGTIPLSRK